MYKEHSELKFFLAKVKDSETHEIKSMWIEIWDGREQIGLSNSIKEAINYVEKYIENDGKEI